MTKYGFSNSLDERFLKRVFNYNLHLLFDANSDIESKFKNIFDKLVAEVKTINHNETTRYVNHRTPGVNYKDENGDYHIEMYGLDSQTSGVNVKDIIHTFMHEYSHVFSRIATLLYEKYPCGKIVKNKHGNEVKHENYGGRILEENIQDRKKVVYGLMFEETTTDILSTIGLISFDPYFNNPNVTADTILKKHFEKWSGAKTGYSFFTSLTRLLIAAFSNNPFLKYQDLINNKKSLISYTTETSRGKVLLANDFLYGVECDPMHLEEVYDKIMGVGSYQDLAVVIDLVFDNYLKMGSIRKIDKDSIKAIMNAIPDFLNKKCNNGIKDGTFSEGETIALKSNFNAIWNSLQDEYGAYFTAEDIQEIKKRNNEF